jgi:hypothetical protein
MGLKNQLPRVVIVNDHVEGSMSTYKIRDKNTGKFSTGGTRPGWTKRGKAWSTLGYLKAHLAQVDSPSRRTAYGPPPTGPHPYVDAEIVEFGEVGKRDVSLLLAEAAEEEREKRRKADEINRKRKADEAKAKVVAEKATLRKLQAKYPNG